MKYRDKDGILHDNVIIKGESAFESAQIGGYSKTEEEFYKDLSDLETKTSVDEKLDSVKSEFDGKIEEVDNQFSEVEAEFDKLGSALPLEIINIVDLSKIVDGYYTNSSVGGALKTIVNAEYSYIVIEIEPNKWYTVNNYYITSTSFSWFLDEEEKGIVNFKTLKDDKTMYMAYENDNDRAIFKTPINAKYFCICNTTASIYKLILANGIVQSINRLSDVNNYPFGKVIKDYSLNVLNEGMNYIYVAPYGSDTVGNGTKDNPFASIYYANEVITDNSKTNPYTIIVARGTYTDLETRFSGIEADVYQGIRCKDYVYYESEDISHPESCKIIWNGAIGFDNPDIEDVFGKCPFHLLTNPLNMSIHTHIKGFAFECTNTRYAFHIESSGYCDEMVADIENCVFIFHGRGDVTNPTTKANYSSVGCGGGANYKINFKNCNFVSDGADYDNWAWYCHDNGDNSQATYKFGFCFKFENCNFNGLALVLSRGEKEGIYSTPNVAIVKNCSKPSSYQVYGSNMVFVKEGTNAND